MGKVLKLADAKNKARELEMLEADDDQDHGGDNKIFQKDVPKIDPFFQEDGPSTFAGEKRAVMRDGRIPKLQKNYEKIIEKKEAHE